MWEFIKYCFKCMLLFLSAGFGGSPDNFNPKDDAVGSIVFVVCAFLLILSIRFFYFIDSKLYDRKMKKEGLQKQDGQGEQNEESLTEEPEVKEDKEPEVIDEAARRKKKKIYTLISTLFFALPIVLVGILMAYSKATGIPMHEDCEWGLILIGIFFIVGFVFLFKSGD